MKFHMDLVYKLPKPHVLHFYIFGLDNGHKQSRGRGELGWQNRRWSHPGCVRPTHYKLNFLGVGYTNCQSHVDFLIFGLYNGHKWSGGRGWQKQKMVTPWLHQASTIQRKFPRDLVYKSPKPHVFLFIFGLNNGYKRSHGGVVSFLAHICALHLH